MKKIGTLSISIFASWLLIWAAAACSKNSSSSSSGDLWSHDNVAAWMVTDSDSKGRDPEERAAMLERLGIKKYVYRAAQQDTATYEKELDALKQHGIELVAWRLDYEPDSPELKLILETIRKHGLHPNLWVTRYTKDLRWPKPDKPEDSMTVEDSYQIFMAAMRMDLAALPQQQRVEQDAERISGVAKMAAQYGLKVDLYNHNGWFGEEQNQVEIIERLKQQGITNVGISYNFVHGRDNLHDDSVNFPALWAKMKPYTDCVIVTGMRMDKHFVLPSQGDAELEMMRTIQQSGWKGIVGLIGEQGGDAEVTMRNNLIGLDWLAAEVKKPGSGGGRPFPDATSDEGWKRTIVEPVVAKATDHQVVDYPWGHLTWFVSKAQKNSDTMTVGEAVIKPGQSNPLHFHPNCDEVLRVVKGKILQTYGDKSVEMSEGDTISIPAGVKHQAKNIGSGDTVLAIAFSSANRRTIGE